VNAESVVRDWVARERAPGIVAVQVRDGRARVVSAGWAEPNVEVHPGHGFAWFSVTKLVTTAAVLREVDSGRLDLETPLSAHLPEVARGAHPSIRDLLAHRAGLPDPIPWGWLSPLPRARRDPVPFALRWLRRHAPRWWLVGSRPTVIRERYSNLDFMALGALLARATGRSPEDLLQRTLHDIGASSTRLEPGPAGASGHLRWGSPFDAAMWVAGARHVSRGRWRRWRVLGAIRMEVAAAGGAFGPALDLARLGQSWLTGAGLGIADELRRAAFAGDQAFGFGFWRDGPTRVRHDGSGLGFVASCALDLARRSALVVLVNRSGGARPEWPGLDVLRAALADDAWRDIAPLDRW